MDLWADQAVVLGYPAPLSPNLISMSLERARFYSSLELPFIFLWIVLQITCEWQFTPAPVPLAPHLHQFLNMAGTLLRAEEPNTVY